MGGSQSAPRFRLFGMHTFRQQLFKEYANTYSLLAEDSLAARAGPSGGVPRVVVTNWGSRKTSKLLSRGVSARCGERERASKDGIQLPGFPESTSLGLCVLGKLGGYPSNSRTSKIGLFHRKSVQCFRLYSLCSALGVLACQAVSPTVIRPRGLQSS